MQKFSRISDKIKAILLVIIAQTVESYAISWYDKVLYKISTLISDIYIKELVN